jgi:CRP-like cAMP-binding protein
MIKYDLNSQPLSKEESLRKPMAAINRLFQVVDEASDAFVLQRHRVLPIFDEPDKQCLYLMTEGRFAISRDSDGLYIATISSPLTLGLSMLFHEELTQERQHTLSSLSECRGYRVPVCLAAERITELNLWPDVAAVLAYLFELLIHRDQHLVGVSAYAMVRYNLMQISEYSNTERMDINVEKYIHQHTRLSRSGIMKILSDLRFGGYINMKRGRLISINNLPENY